jgi:hypothetical protein
MLEFATEGILFSTFQPVFVCDAGAYPLRCGAAHAIAIRPEAQCASGLIISMQEAEKA